MGDAVGVSASTIIRLEKRGFIAASSKSSRGWLLFSESQVDEAKRHLQMRIPREKDREASSTSKTFSSNAQFEADVATRVFKELEKGKHPSDIVQELVIHPDIVKSIFLRWVEFRGGLYIPQSIMNKISGLPLEGSWPCLTAEELLENLKASAAATLPQCLRCNKEDRIVCKACAEALYKR